MFFLTNTQTFILSEYVKPIKYTAKMNISTNVNDEIKNAVNPA